MMVINHLILHSYKSHIGITCYNSQNFSLNDMVPEVIDISRAFPNSDSRFSSVAGDSVAVFITSSSSSSLESTQ